MNIEGGKREIVILEFEHLNMFVPFAIVGVNHIRFVYRKIMNRYLKEDFYTSEFEATLKRCLDLNLESLIVALNKYSQMNDIG